MLLDDVDTAKKMLNDGFGTLLTCKLGIDVFNTVASVYFIIYKLLYRSGLRRAFGMVDFTFYEFPYIVMNILMIRYFQALADEVSYGPFNVR